VEKYITVFVFADVEQAFAALINETAEKAVIIP